MGGASRHRPFVTTPAHSSITSRPPRLRQVPAAPLRIIPNRTLTRRHPIAYLPFRQRIRAVHTHLPPANACALIGAGGRQSLPMYDVRCTMYDLNYSAPKARAMRSFSEGGGEIMGGRWFERDWIMQSCVPGFATSQALPSASRRFVTTSDRRFTIHLPIWLRAPAPQARELPKLTHRHHPAGSPLRGSASALSIRTYRPLTRAPLSGPSCVLYLVHRHRQVPPSYIVHGRRQPPPPLSNYARSSLHDSPPDLASRARATGARISQIVPRTSYLVHRHRQVPPSYIVHRQTHFLMRLS